MLSAQEMDGLQKIAPFRNPRLFSEFLPRGYALTTLSSVENREMVIGLKVILGSIITLYDDFADRPERLNPKLLQMLYRVPFERFEINSAFLSEEEVDSLNLANSLFDTLMLGIDRMGAHESLVELFNFDLKQFFLANHYSELLTRYSNISNGLENRMYLHHNMGIVMAGMIDLMSLPNLKISEVGKTRALFLLGQRAGRISNVLTTREREQRENDVTSELLAFGTSEEMALMTESMKEELNSLYKEMDRYKSIQSFSAHEYRSGMQALHELHLSFEGVI